MSVKTLRNKSTNMSHSCQEKINLDSGDKLSVKGTRLMLIKRLTKYRQT